LDDDDDKPVWPTWALGFRVCRVFTASLRSLSSVASSDAMISAVVALACVCAHDAMELPAMLVVDVEGHPVDLSVDPELRPVDLNVDPSVDPELGPVAPPLPSPSRLGSPPFSLSCSLDVLFL